jgi:opacity protein-like surface antigen
MIRNALLLLAAACVLATAARAQEPSPSAAADAADSWHWRAGVPVWLAGLSGSLTVRGHELVPSEDPGDISLFSSYISGAAAFHVEAEKGRFGLLMDWLYIEERAEPAGPSGSPAEAALRGFVGELGGFYTWSAPKPDERGLGTFRADVLGGVRYTSLESGVHTSFFDSTSSNSVIDPFVGARMQVGITDWLDFALRGDVGGFGLAPGTTSNLVWNLDTGLMFHVSKVVDLGLGYRWLDYDFRNGSGGGQTELDLRLDGPTLTFQLSFSF